MKAFIRTMFGVQGIWGTLVYLWNWPLTSPIYVYFLGLGIAFIMVLVDYLKKTE